MKCIQLGASLLAGSVPLFASTSLARAQEATVRVSESSTGQPADWYTFTSAISANGRFVVFSSSAGDLVPNDLNYQGDVFVRDRDPDGNGILDEGNSVTTCMSLDPLGNVGDGDSGGGAMSLDGRYVAFSSDADTLVANDMNVVRDVFVRDRDPDGNGIFDEGNDVTVRVTVDPNGVEADFGSDVSSMSADGRYVAFTSYADNLVANDLNGVADVFVFDRDPDGNGVFDEGNGFSALMSVRKNGAQADLDCFDARITANGRHVAFWSGATTLVAHDTNGCEDVFVHDRDPDGNGIFDEGNGATVRVSLDSAGVQGDATSFDPSISADGRHVAFVSGAHHLVPNDTNNVYDVFTHDRDPDGNGIFDEGNGVTTRVSVDSSGAQANSGCEYTEISADGRIVAFSSSATNLVPNDSSWYPDAFTHDRDPDGNGIFDEGNGVTTRVSENFCDFESDGTSYVGAISADGRFVGFDSDASNLAPDGQNFGVSQAYVRDRAALPADASWNNYGAGFPGKFGIPTLTSSANPVIGTTLQIGIGGSSGTWTVGLLLVGTGQASTATRQGGTILVDWTYIIPMVVWPGGVTWPLAIPPEWSFCRDSAFLQVVEFDAGAQYGVSFSPGLELIVGH